MYRFNPIGILLPALLFAVAAAGEPLRMNQIQVIGTHNSYHLRAEGKVFDYMRQGIPEMAALDYTHAPLEVQLNTGVRSFELDVQCLQDGFHVYHVPIVDTGTTCALIADCLGVVKAWSDAHPHHVPISFLLEIKEEESVLLPEARPVDAATLADLDAAIVSVFPRDRIVTPDDVRGDAPTLEEAILTRGWPLLDDTRGKVFFTLHEDGYIRDNYVAGHPSLEARVMFVRSEPGRPDAATLVLDAPIVEKLRPLVKQGYYIRTRVRDNAEKDVERALATGAQILSTDFPPGEPNPVSGFAVRFPGNAPAMIDSVNGPPDRVSQALLPDTEEK